MVGLRGRETLAGGRETVGDGARLGARGREAVEGGIARARLARVRGASVELRRKARGVAFEDPARAVGAGFVLAFRGRHRNGGAQESEDGKKGGEGLHGNQPGAGHSVGSGT